MKDIGDRMKRNYEDRSRFYLTKRTPVIIRVDGRAFHTYTKSFQRPFDGRIELAMKEAMRQLCMEAQGAKFAYTQSDEISVLLTDWDNLDTESWFDYNLQKLCSISASIVTSVFNRYMGGTRLAQFDARAFNIPREEVTNYFLWRAKDWYRNSVTMYAQAFFSHKQLHGVNVAGMHELLHTVGKNWATDLTPAQKNGTFYYRDDDWWVANSIITPNFPDISSYMAAYL